MTTYEFLRWLTFPLMPTHLVTVRNDLKQLLKSEKARGNYISLLDVGGRKSPYTINLAANVTLLDVPQEEGTKEQLNLGFTEAVLANIKKKRSNIKAVIIQDMTQSTLVEASYDAVVSIEVIEHVEADDLFVKNIAGVIKKGGWAYFTTPNGDFIKNEGAGKNPDHIRHYTKAELQALLERHFDTVGVHYAVKTGKYRVWSLKSLKTKNPLTMMRSLVGVVVNRFQSKGIKHSSQGTAHLVAVAYK